MCGALQGAEVRKDLLQADARERKYQCHSSGKTTAGDMGISCCQVASSGKPNVSAEFCWNIRGGAAQISETVLSETDPTQISNNISESLA